MSNPTASYGEKMPPSPSCGAKLPPRHPRPTQLDPHPPSSPLVFDGAYDLRRCLRRCWDPTASYGANCRRQLLCGVNCRQQLPCGAACGLHFSDPYHRSVVEPLHPINVCSSTRSLPSPAAIPFCYRIADLHDRASLPQSSLPRPPPRRRPIEQKYIMS